MEKSARKGKKTLAKARAPRETADVACLRLGRANIILFGWALAAIILGFVALALGSTTISVVLLVGGYLVLLPWAILTRRGQSLRRPDSVPDRAP